METRWIHNPTSGHTSLMWSPMSHCWFLSHMHTTKKRIMKTLFRESHWVSCFVLSCLIWWWLCINVKFCFWVSSVFRGCDHPHQSSLTMAIVGLSHHLCYREDGRMYEPPWEAKKEIFWGALRALQLGCQAVLTTRKSVIEVEPHGSVSCLPGTTMPCEKTKPDVLIRIAIGLVSQVCFKLCSILVQTIYAAEVCIYGFSSYESMVFEGSFCVKNLLLHVGRWWERLSTTRHCGYKNRDPILVCVAWLPTSVLSININHLALVFINQLTFIDHRDQLQQLAVKFLTRKCLNASREMPKFQTQPYIWLPSFLVLT